MLGIVGGLTACGMQKVEEFRLKSRKSHDDCLKSTRKGPGRYGSWDPFDYSFLKLTASKVGGLNRHSNGILVQASYFGSNHDVAGVNTEGSWTVHLWWILSGSILLPPQKRQQLGSVACDTRIVLAVVVMVERAIRENGRLIVNTEGSWTYIFGGSFG
jgi:hypothetical protein